MRKVLFICTANRCRSPMAEVLLRDLAGRHEEGTQWQVQSAGTWAEPGQPATQLAQAVMAARRLNLADHRSRPLDEPLLQAADVILVMTRHHQEALKAEFPAVAGRVYLMSQLLDQKFDIEDPYGGSRDDYEACAADLQHILTDGWARLVELTDQGAASTRLS
jgi:protein-tyrosine phosphatase